MSAIVTILRSETEESVQMYVDPEEKIEEVIDRCMGYWQMSGDAEDHSLSKGNTELIPTKTIISSDVQEGDVLRFGKSKDEEIEEEDGETEDVKDRDAVELAESWLQQNIGLDKEDIALIGSSDGGEENFKLVFENTEIDEHYTVVVGSEGVTNYMPAIVDDVDIEEA